MSKKRGHGHPLIRYIDEQLKSGYSEHHIKKHLKDYGHHPSIIERSFKIVKKKHFHYLSKIVIIFCITVSLFLLIWTALSTNAKALAVLIGFSPTILCLIIAITLIEKPKHRTLHSLWYLPAILVLLFLVIGNISNLTIMQNMEINKLAALNFIVSFIFIIILYLTGSLEREHIEIVPEKKSKSKIIKHINKINILSKDKKQKPSKENIKQYLESVEDKCKALNFAIGRVYSNKKAGSDTLRNKIKINKQWYNEISSALKDGYNKAQDKTKILNNINKIRDRLNILHKTEKQVFAHKQVNLKNLNRAEDGSDKILHVLIKNDKDPVKSYFDSAIEFCERAKKLL